MRILLPLLGLLSLVSLLLVLPYFTATVSVAVAFIIDDELLLMLSFALFILIVVEVLKDVVLRGLVVVEGVGFALVLANSIKGLELLAIDTRSLEDSSTRGSLLVGLITAKNVDSGAFDEELKAQEVAN